MKPYDPPRHHPRRNLQQWCHDQQELRNHVHVARVQFALVSFGLLLLLGATLVLLAYIAWPEQVHPLLNWIGGLK